MPVESDIEQFKNFTEVLCVMWADTFLFADHSIQIYLQSSMMLFMDLTDTTDLQKLKEYNAALDECEFLHSYIETNCRHNNYGKQH